jgi:hypothetical protein
LFTPPGPDYWGNPERCFSRHRGSSSSPECRRSRVVRGLRGRVSSLEPGGHRQAVLCSLGASGQQDEGQIGERARTAVAPRTHPLANPLQTNRRKPLQSGPNFSELGMGQTFGKSYATTLFRSPATSRKQAFPTAERNGVQVVVGSNPTGPTRYYRAAFLLGFQAIGLHSVTRKSMNRV